MHTSVNRTICWAPTWRRDFENIGLEHVVLKDNMADSVLVAYDEMGVPFRLAYQLKWDTAGCLREADLRVWRDSEVRYLGLRSDGNGRWAKADGQPLPNLDGCIDIDIWPTPLTNSFPLWRSHLRVGERREYRMTWVSAPDLTVAPKPQAYSRLGDRLFLYENLDGTAFQAQ
ncbi:MAG TPA: putative glycolipid-binding domain-containing protein, partial [Hydrogenophaga sp.]